MIFFYHSAVSRDDTFINFMGIYRKYVCLHSVASFFTQYHILKKTSEIRLVKSARMRQIHACKIISSVKTCANFCHSNSIPIKKMVFKLIYCGLIKPYGGAVLTAPTNYLNHCWLIFKDALLYLTEGNFRERAHEFKLEHIFEGYTSKSTAYFWIFHCPTH